METGFNIFRSLKTYSLKNIACLFTASALLAACGKETSDIASFRTGDNSQNPANGSTNKAVLLVIDEESIENGNAPNNFSDKQVNDDIASIGLRATLPYFKSNIGKTINLYTGEVGDEGWFAIKTIPSSWSGAGPYLQGARNYVYAGPGLGGGNDPERFLDKIPDVTPLRARGLAMLTGQKIFAIVYDSDVSINYSPLNGSLKGANLGWVALEVERVTKRTDGSSGSLPVVQVRILDVESIRGFPLYLFSNAPVPASSSEPYDITPPAEIPAISLNEAK
jgi:hypothetical protein